eukprot:TRINITY_DN24233_c0_g1_i1.p1 TRINITY_DN24233_c0_g1~~TRINITY_DN24233_c0_g1_i1.p1  ORF type:complete len:194 (+),score=46.97 TRINITY_DN24233_c0_g1_i1:71-583(+)
MCIRDRYVISRADQPLTTVANFYTGHAITSLQLINVPNTYDAGAGAALPENTSVPMVLYGTILGKAGCLLPFLYEEDAVLAAYTEPIIRGAWVSPLNRTLDSFYNSFYPHTGVIDGDILQQLTVRTNTAFLSESEKASILSQLTTVSYTHLRAHETVLDLVCRLLLEKKK